MLTTLTALIHRLSPVRRLRQEVRRLEDEAHALRADNQLLRRLARGLADRCAAQSDLLSRRAEATHPDDHEGAMAIARFEDEGNPHSEA